MVRPRSTSCAHCGKPKTDIAAFWVIGKFEDGSSRLSSWCRECANARPTTPGQRAAAIKWKRKRRLETAGDRGLRLGDDGRLHKAACVNGHPKTPANTRAGRYDCAICHQDRQRQAERARGAQPRLPAGSRWACDHDPTTSMRYAKGKPAGCRICHRIRELGRPRNPQRQREYAARNRTKLRLYYRAWRAVHRPYGVEWRGASRGVRQYVQIISTDPCVYCGAPSTQIDHIIAVARGGTNGWENFAPTCRGCNARKHTRDVLQFMLRRLSRSEGVAGRSAGHRSDEVADGLGLLPGCVRLALGLGLGVGVAEGVAISGTTIGPATVALAAGLGAGVGMGVTA